jgi:hypothetical protein
MESPVDQVGLESPEDQVGMELPEDQVRMDSPWCFVVQIPNERYSVTLSARLGVSAHIEMSMRM